MKIHYAVLDSKNIANLCGPERTPTGWSPYIIEKRRIKTEEYIKRVNKINGFYNNLEKSVLEEGFRNPILVCAGFFSEEYRGIDPKPANTKLLKFRVNPVLLKKENELIVCNAYGGSRLWIAQRYNLKIPCIVNDFVGLFNGLPELKNTNDVLKYFTDKPEHLRFEAIGIYFSALPQTHIEKKKPESYIIKYAVVPARKIENAIQLNRNRIKRMENEQKFFSKLEESILKEGFRNPICINATKDKLINRYGGSRLMFAQKYNMDIPCIIADFDNVFPDAKIVTVPEIRGYFADPPAHVRAKPEGLNISGCEHVHLGDDGV